MATASLGASWGASIRFRVAGRGRGGRGSWSGGGIATDCTGDGSLTVDTAGAITGVGAAGSSLRSTTVRGGVARRAGAGVGLGGAAVRGADATVVDHGGRQPA